MKKTKVIRISRKEGRKLKILIEGHKLDQVEQFVYLGSLVIEDGRCTKEVRRRIALGETASSKRKELLRGSLSLGLKKRMVKVLVWSVVSYGSETWTLRQKDIRSLEAFEMWICSSWRRMMKIPWTQHASNEQILGMVDESRYLMENLRKRQKNWIGHVLRHNSLLQKVIEGRFQGKKTPGRPRTILLDALMQEDEESAMDYAKLKEKAHDRETWRQ